MRVLRTMWNCVHVEKNEPFMVNGVDESFRSPSIDFSEDIVRNKEQVGDTHAANEKSRDELA